MSIELERYEGAETGAENRPRKDALSQMQIARFLDRHCANIECSVRRWKVRNCELGSVPPPIALCNGASFVGC